MTLRGSRPLTPDMARNGVFALAILVLLLSSSPAGAEPRGPFVTLDRITPPNRLVLDLSMLLPEENGWLWRADLHCHFVTRVGIGGYAQLGYTQWTNDLRLTDVFPDAERTDKLGSRSASGNLELGAIYATHPSAEVSITARVGVVLPTGPSPTKGLNFLANMVGAFGRLSDLEQFTFDTTWLRVGASANGTFDDLFFQADVSVSFGFESKDYLDAHNGIHLNAGAGYRLGNLAAMLELATLVSFAAETAMLLAPGVSARYDAGVLEPHASIVFPVATEGGGAGTVFMAGVTHAF